MSVNTLHELVSTRFWNLEQSAFQNYKSIIFKNIENRIPFNLDSQKTKSVFLKQSIPTDNKDYVGNAVWIECCEDLEDTDNVINVIHIDGPITRSGGACSYGSLYMRDQLMKAADMPHTIGHIMVLNTPGGSSSSLQDIQYAFEYIRSKEQPIIALIDGVCASMGTGFASQCDEIYFVNPKDEIGSIGTYAAGFTNKDGDINAITQERYFEIYASDSEDKNKWIRDLSEGNYNETEEQVKECNDNFKEQILKGRSKILPEQMTGKMYPCGEVIGTLVDGQSTLSGVANLILSRNSKSKSNSTTSSKNTSSAPKTNNSQKQKGMKKQYPKLQSALNVEELGVDSENGVHLAEPLATEIESHLTSLEEKSTNLQGQLTALEERAQRAESALATANETIEQNISSHATAIQELEASHASAIEALKASHQETLDALNLEHTNAIDALNATIASKDEELGTMSAEIEELKAGPGPEGSTGAQPDHNNAGAPHVVISTGKTNPYATPAERAAANKEREAELAKLARSRKQN